MIIILASICISYLVYRVTSRKEMQHANKRQEALAQINQELEDYYKEKQRQYFERG